MRSLLEIRPGYGWGWFEGDDLVEVPASFLADVESGDGWAGRVVSGGYTSWHVELTARHRPFDGDVNLRLRSEDGQRLIDGYARISPEG